MSHIFNLVFNYAVSFIASSSNSLQWIMPIITVVVAVPIVMGGLIITEKGNKSVSVLKWKSVRWK